MMRDKRITIQAHMWPFGMVIVLYEILDKGKAINLTLVRIEVHQGWISSETAMDDFRRSGPEPS